jgi:hypothetical protein
MMSGLHRPYSLKAGIAPSMQDTNPSPFRAENEFPWIGVSSTEARPRRRIMVAYKEFRDEQPSIPAITERKHS